MSINVGYEVLVDASVTADKKAELARKIIQVLEPQTLSLVYAATYAANADSHNQATIAVGGASPDFGIRAIMDSAVVGTGVVAKLLRQLIQTLEAETITIAHAADYAAGSEVYNITITIT